jgi:nitroreductase
MQDGPPRGTGLDSFDAIVEGRRSARHYQPRSVPDHLIRELIDLARRAPSSMDGQPWIFIVIRAAATRQRLAKIKNDYCPPEKRSYPADFVAEAPVVVAVCVEKSRAFDREIENGVLATALLLLSARSRGLAGVYLSALRTDDPGLERSIRELLHLPGDVLPVALVPLGYPALEPSPKALRPLEKIIRHEAFDSDL